MRSLTSDNNFVDRIIRKMRNWEYTQNRQWVEFVIIASLLTVCMFSMASMILSNHEAKLARVVAIDRFEIIYGELMKSENELKAMKVKSSQEENLFHGNLAESMKTQDEIMRKIAEKVGVDGGEIKELLSKDPIYRN